MRKGPWMIDGEEVKKSKKPHSECCACNCVVDLIKELRSEAKTYKLWYEETKKEFIESNSMRAVENLRNETLKHKH